MHSCSKQLRRRYGNLTVKQWQQFYGNRYSASFQQLLLLLVVYQHIIYYHTVKQAQVNHANLHVALYLAFKCTLYGVCHVCLYCRSAQQYEPQHVEQYQSRYHGVNYIFESLFQKQVSVFRVYMTATATCVTLRRCVSLLLRG